MAKAMASSTFLADAKGYRHTDAVYFDVLGLFVVVFSHSSAAGSYAAAIAVSLLLALASWRVPFEAAVKGQVVSFRFASLRVVCFFYTVLLHALWLSLPPPLSSLTYSTYAISKSKQHACTQSGGGSCYRRWRHRHLRCCRLSLLRSWCLHGVVPERGFLRARLCSSRCWRSPRSSQLAPPMARRREGRWLRRARGINGLRPVLLDSGRPSLVIRHSVGLPLHLVRPSPCLGAQLCGLVRLSRRARERRGGQGKRCRARGAFRMLLLLLLLLFHFILLCLV